MGVFEMITVVVVIGCITGIINNYLRIRQKASVVHGEDVDEAFERIENLEERIRVLEKVVTDDRYDLEKQIDQLDKQ